MDCPFCKQEVIDNQKVFEGDHVYVLHNIRPANTGQCVVFPKRHVENIRELNQEELSELILTVQMVSNKLNEHLEHVGFNYGFNEGHHSGQRVPHFHFHILPRKDGDYDRLPEFHLFHRAPSSKRNLEKDELRPLVEEIRDVLN